MSDEPVEIVARPPSSPIAAVLLIVCCLGTSLAIAVTWWELFTEYMPASTGPGAPPQDPEMGKHKIRADAENHTIDHYALDFPGNKETLIAVQDELGVSEKIGDLSNVSSSPPPSDSPPPPPADEGGKGEPGGKGR